MAQEKRRNIPDCLDICGPVDSLRLFYELYRLRLASSRFVWLTPEEFATSPRWLSDYSSLVS